MSTRLSGAERAEAEQVLRELERHAQNERREEHRQARRARIFRAFFYGCVGLYVGVILVYSSLGDWDAVEREAKIMAALVAGWVLRSQSPSR